MITISGEPVPFSGTAGSTNFTRVYVTNKRGDKSFARKLDIRCDDAANDLLVSFDGGATSFTIGKGTSRQVEAALSDFSVKGVGGNSAWSAIATVA